MIIMHEHARERMRRAGFLIAGALILLTTMANAQVFELRRAFERFETGKILLGGEILGPVNSQLDPETARKNVAYSVPVIPSAYLSIDYWQLRAGARMNGLRSIAPFIFWNPIIDGVFGGDASRWSGTIGWENILVASPDYNPKTNFQADNSLNDPGNSFSVMVDYWFGSEPDSVARRQLLQQAYPDINEGNLDQWLNERSRFELNYSGHGTVDTTSFSAPPLDTNSYIRGPLPKNALPLSVPVRYSTRNGFSLGLGLGSGKYSGSGPISKALNIFYPGDTSESVLNNKILGFGLNPMMTIRYRYDDYIGELDLAGEDVNLGMIFRNIPDFDVEAGVKYLEHIFYRRSRGPNRPEFFIGVRYTPPFQPSYNRQEIGDEVFEPEADTDGDGVPDGIERDVTHTDPHNQDTDGDGLTDGLEVFRFKTNPLSTDSDNDGLSDGQEVLIEGRRSDPLRWDTDEDGISDGEEVSRGTDPLLPATGERGR
jgi:hypothetical protein